MDPQRIKILKYYKIEKAGNTTFGKDWQLAKPESALLKPDHQAYLLE